MTRWLDAVGALVGAWLGVASVAAVAARFAVRKMTGGRGPVTRTFGAAPPDLDVEQVASDVLSALAKMQDQP